MKNISLLVFLLLFITACSEPEVEIPTCENCAFDCTDADSSLVVSNDCPESGSCTFTVHSLSAIDIEDLKGVKTGKKNVFKLVIISEDDPLLFDDEFSISLVFELNESQNSFSAIDKQLSDMQMHYRKSCFCPEIQFIEVASGCVQGVKQTDGNWRIQGDIIASYSDVDRTLAFDAIFSN